MLYARALESCNVRELMTSVSSAPAPVAGGAAVAAEAGDDAKTETAADSKGKKEPESDSGSDEEGFGGLFD